MTTVIPTPWQGVAGPVGDRGPGLWGEEHPGYELSAGALGSFDGTQDEERFLHFLERQVARGQKGSVRRARAQHRLNRFRSRINRRIHDWRHKTTTTLAKNHGLIVAEILALKNMTASARGTVEAPGTNVAQKAGLNRTLLEPGCGIIMQLLAYKHIRGHFTP